MKLRFEKRPAVLLVFAVFQLVLVLLVYGSVQGTMLATDQGPEPDFEGKVGATASESGLANCRYGVDAVNLTDQYEWVDDLGAGWYLSFSPSYPAASNNAEFVPMVFVNQDRSPTGDYLPTYTVWPRLTEWDLGAYIDNRPGSLWIVGNEVDRGPDPGQTWGGQGNTFPDVYAEAYHEIYHYIKGRDPLAQVAISALVEVTPGRLQYLDLMWQAYEDLYGTAPPVDVFNMHLYILPEVTINGLPNAVANIALGTDPALGRRESGGVAALCPSTNVYCVAEHDDISVFAEQVLAMRTWMRDRGYRYRPLIISEYSILYPYVINGGSCWVKDEYGNCFTPSRVANFAVNAHDYLETAVDSNLGYPLDNNRLVQQWAWFSVNNGYRVGKVSNLVNNDLTALTNPVGVTYRDYVLAQPGTINLFPDQVSHPTSVANGGTADVTIWITLRNNGNMAPGSSFDVTFYENANLTQPIGSASIQPPGPIDPGMAGCARREIKVSVDWTGLTPGLHRYWAKVDSGGSVQETNEGDNVAVGFVIVDANQSFFPVLKR